VCYLGLRLGLDADVVEDEEEVVLRPELAGQPDLDLMVVGGLLVVDPDRRVELGHELAPTAASINRLNSKC
jgi:hypothetical protein